MNDISLIVLYAGCAGIPIFVGGLLSSFITLKRSVNHWVVAFGGGALFSAIAFALIPRAIETLNVTEIIIIFLAGTGSFMFVDMIIARSNNSFSQLLSMMMDYVPEALVLGASFAHNHKFGLLMAIFIGLQNLPEGFNSYIELRKKLSNRKTLLLMFFLSFVGIFSALAGKFLLSDHPRIIACILLYSGGGILYLIFQDIAPLSHEKNDWIPATGANLGFLLGMIGEKFLQ